MGVVADAALAAGGEVVGVMPEALVAKEIAHRGLTELRVTGSMHERKALMAELADGFIALPGGLGTFDELCEILTWGQLGLHAKPVVLLDVEGFWDAVRRAARPRRRGRLPAGRPPRPGPPRRLRGRGPRAAGVATAAADAQVDRPGLDLNESSPPDDRGTAQE